MRLTETQRQLVEDNLGLVTQVIKDCVRDPNSTGIFTYDDIFQTGCLGLCKAAGTYTEGGRAQFGTYAYILIRNAIYTRLEYATLRNMRERLYDPDELPMYTEADYDSNTGYEELLSQLDSIAASKGGIIAKGIEALHLHSQGFSCKEIGECFGGTKANHVSAWMSRARRHLRDDPIFTVGQS